MARETKVEEVTRIIQQKEIREQVVWNRVKSEIGLNEWKFPCNFGTFGLHFLIFTIRHKSKSEDDRITMIRINALTSSCIVILSAAE